MLKWVSSVYNSTPVDVRTLNFWYVICYTISLKMARFGNSKRLSVKSSFLEPKCGQKSQIWPPCDQIALGNWIIYMNLHFNWRKNFGCGGPRATILSVSQLLSVKIITIIGKLIYTFWRQCHMGEVVQCGTNLCIRFLIILFNFEKCMLKPKLKPSNFLEKVLVKQVHHTNLGLVFYKLT